MATAILERQGEIGLMRSLGASKGAIALLFYTEAGILALLTGVLGYIAGSAIATWVGAKIFGAAVNPSIGDILNPVLLPVIIALALVVAIAGSTPSIRRALSIDPSMILRANA
jgi:putative ABC transport system permease protein